MGKLEDGVWLLTQLGKVTSNRGLKEGLRWRAVEGRMCGGLVLSQNAFFQESIKSSSGVATGDFKKCLYSTAIVKIEVILLNPDVWLLSKKSKDLRRPAQYREYREYSQ